MGSGTAYGAACRRGAPLSRVCHRLIKEMGVIHGRKGHGEKEKNRNQKMWLLSASFLGETPRFNVDCYTSRRQIDVAD